MKPETKELISLGAEAIYRIANFAPGDREETLTEMDKPGIAEVEGVLTALMKEQDKRTRHACAEAVNAIASEPTISGSGSIKLVVVGFCQRAHQACMNTQAI